MIILVRKCLLEFYFCLIEQALPSQHPSLFEAFISKAGHFQGFIEFLTQDSGDSRRVFHVMLEAVANGSLFNFAQLDRRWNPMTQTSTTLRYLAGKPAYLPRYSRNMSIIYITSTQLFNL